MTPHTNALIYYRLIALWILCEAMLGGIIHGAKLPVSGLIVGSCSVICISLIAYYVPAKGNIMRATVIVAIFKMMLSPQAPPTAYFAVFFQGLLGESLFWNRKLYSLSCLLFGLLVLLESGLQRIIILTIFYGDDLWHAINIFMNGLTKGLTNQTTLINYSYFFVVGYVFVHIIAGLLVGVCAGRMPTKIRLWTALHKNYLLAKDTNDLDVVMIDSQRRALIRATRKKNKLRNSVIFIWLALLILYLQATLNIGPPLLPSNLAIKILIRSLLVMLTFYFLIGPSLTWLLNRWLQKRKVSQSKMIQTILTFLPQTKWLISQSWQLAADNKGIRRVLLCAKIILLNTVHSAHHP